MPRSESNPVYTVRNRNGSTSELSLDRAVEVPLSPEEAKRLEPAEEDSERFKTFLNKPNTGLVKIFPDPKCKSDLVLDLNDPKCGGELSMPGRGAFFSFRLDRNYPFPYADIHFDDGNFKVGSKNGIGIISKIGDKEIEDINAKSPEIQFLREFKPARTKSKITDQAKLISAGISDGGLSFSSSADAAPGQTYILRTVAYEFQEAYYNDRRVDMIIVFRVVRQDADGALTLLWHRLKKSGAPYIRNW